MGCVEATTASNIDNMMRIAIAGSGGLARLIAAYLGETPHPFIILSRQVGIAPDLDIKKDADCLSRLNPI